MKREIICIDETKCDGCGLCVPNCHEGALQIIDNKAVLVSELMCDGLGACVGHCPQDALTIEEREADAYDEIAVMKEMVHKGRNVVMAHLKHLKDHQEHAYLKQGVQYLMEHKSRLTFNPVDVIQAVHQHGKPQNLTVSGQETQIPETAPTVAGMAVDGPPVGGCPGARTMAFEPAETDVEAPAAMQASALRQWPVQLHLINPAAGYFGGADLLVAADCVAYSVGNFHQDYLKNKSLVIACPKLDSNLESYLQKLIALIDDSLVNTITVMVMEVPCCGGLLSLVQQAAGQARRKVPVKALQVSIRGEVLVEEWV